MRYPMEVRFHAVSGSWAVKALFDSVRGTVILGIYVLASVVMYDVIFGEVPGRPTPLLHKTTYCALSLVGQALFISFVFFSLVIIRDATGFTPVALRKAMR